MKDLKDKVQKKGKGPVIMDEIAKSVSKPKKAKLPVEPKMDGDSEPDSDDMPPKKPFQKKK